MDPLSLTIGTLTLLGAIKKSGDGLKLLFKLPKDAEELLNDTIDLRYILEHLKSELSRSGSNISSHPPTVQHLLIESVLEKANTLLHDILAVVKVDPQAAMRDLASPPAEWHVSRRKVIHIHKLRERLSMIKSNITIALVVANSTRAQSLAEAVSDLSQELNDSRGASPIEVLDKLADLSILLSQVYAGTRLLPFTTRTGEMIILGSTKTTQSTNNINTAGDTAGSANLEMLPQSENAQSVARYRPSSPFIRPRSNSCSAGCTCRCHMKYSIKTAKAFHHIIGGMSVAVIPPKSISGKCNEAKCRKRSSPKIHVECFLPPWLILAILSLTITNTSPYAFNIDLRARRLVPNNAPVFRFATQGDLANIRRLFEEGLASPHDVDSAGTSALVYAMDRGTYLDITDRRYIELWRYLLEKGADPYLETDKQHCPMDVACGRILGEITSEEAATALKEDLDIGDYLEQKSLPVLHRIVLGLLKKDLEAHLEESTALIDELDYQGRTALSWAAIRGQRTELDILLRYGADPNIVAFNGDAPLHYATRARTPHCIASLIASGANINALNAWNVSPLMLTAMNRDDVLYMQPLIDVGAQVDVRDGQGRSVIVRCISLNRPNLVRLLLNSGASVLEGDTWVNHPLKIALELSTSEIASMVFEAGKGDLTRKQITDLLDLALERGHVKVANLLQNLGMESEECYVVPGAWE